jgi:simple sugar transport system substrate-binding protein
MRIASTLTVVLGAVTLTLLAAGCEGGKKSAGPVNATATGSLTAQPPVGRPKQNVRIVIVTHGQASDPFWAVVRRGIDEAARDLGVTVSYQAPDVFDASRMRTLIETAVTTKPDGLVVSIPDATVLGPAISQAAGSGIPVVAINSGADAFRRLGALLYVGQPEYAAGVGAGRRMAAAGVRNAICVNHQVGASSLDQRCRGFAAALARAGGRSRVLTVDLQSQTEAERRIAAAASSGGVDGVLTLGPGGATPALEAFAAKRLFGKVKLATFDLAPDILRGLRSRKLLFAIDQQPFLQGYLPILFLSQRKLYGLIPADGTVIPTGPNFVTPASAALVQQLTSAGIRG